MDAPGAVFSEKAFLGIVAETYEKVGTETGGIFLGRKAGQTWYILETLDPGPNSIFQTAYFEYDTPYVTHLANKTARFYKNRVELIGLWHRHPGNLSRFSSTDDGTNENYAQLLGGEALSVLVNLVPDFQLTIYQVQLPLRYTTIRYSVGNQHIPEEFLQRKQIEDFTGQRLPQLAQERSHPRKTKKDSSVLKALRSAPGKLLNGIFRTKNRPDPEDISHALANPMASANVEVLDMIDSEIDYLTRQPEYEFSMRPQCERVLVSMKYRHDLAKYPKQLNFTFGSANRQGYVLIGNGRDSHAYHPNFIRDYINERIRNYLETDVNHG